MGDTFSLVLFGVMLVSVVVAVLTLRSSGDAYRQIGRGGLSIGNDPAPARAPAGAERDAEIRQLLEARNARRARRGQAPLDVEAELRRLSSAGVAVDPGLREEVRQLVVARNARRVRAGRAPLDVEAEVARQLRALSGQA